MLQNTCKSCWTSAKAIQRKWLQSQCHIICKYQELTTHILHVCVDLHNFAYICIDQLEWAAHHCGTNDSDNVKAFKKKLQTYIFDKYYKKAFTFAHLKQSGKNALYWIELSWVSRFIQWCTIIWLYYGTIIWQNFNPDWQLESKVSEISKCQFTLFSKSLDLST